MGRGHPRRKKNANYGFKIFIFLSGIILGCAVSTQYFAYLAGYQPALGTPIAGKIYFPFAFIKWFINWHSASGAQKLLEQALASGLAVTSVIFLLAAISFQFKKNKGIVDLHGSARFATMKEIGDAGLLKKSGVFVGALKHRGRLTYLIHDGPEHVLCYAPTRSGKGVGLVIPTLLFWQHSVVITDLKGELWALTAGWRKKYIDNICLRYEPSSSNSCKWNPLDEVRIDDDEYAVGDVQNIAQLIVDPDGKGLEDHWQKTSFALITGCILHLLYKKKKDPTVKATLSALDEMLANPNQPLSELWNDMITFSHHNGSASPTVQRAAQDMKDRPPNEAGSVLSTVKSYLSLYRDPMVEKNTSYSNFKIKDLMNSEKPVSLYIVTQPADKSRLKPLVRLLVSMIVRVQASKMEFVESKVEDYTFFQKLTRLITFRSIKKLSGGMIAKGVYKHRQLLMLDEFPSLGKLEIMQESLAFIAGYGMKAYLICQDIAQLRDDKTGYGRNESISSNCHIQNCYPPGNLETREYVSKMTGVTTIVKETVTRTKRGFSFSEDVQRGIQETQRALMTADEVGTMPGPKKDAMGTRIEEGGDMLIFVAGFHPIYGKQPLFFLDTMFLKRSSVKPPDSSDVIYEEGKNFEVSP